MTTQSPTESRTNPNHELMDAARAILERACLVDLTPLQSADALRALADLDQILGEATRERLLRRPFGAVEEARLSGADARWIPTGFNPLYPQPVMRFEDDGSVVATWRSSAFDEGPLNSVHGGVSAFLIDVVAGVMIQASGIRAVTAQLDVKYRHRLPLDADIEIRSRLVQTTGRKHVVHAEIVHEGNIAVSAQGLFITIDN